MASMYGAFSTVIASSAVREFKAGDRIRMVIMRPAPIISTGTSHGGNGDPMIGKPNGLSYSKGLKITTL